MDSGSTSPELQMYGGRKQPQRPPRILLLRLRRCRFGGELWAATSAKEVLHVEKGDVNHEPDNEEGAGGLHYFEHTHVDRAPSHRFHNRKQNVAAIEHRNRQQIKQREINIE